MHPSSGNIGPNGGAVLHQQQPHPPPPPSSLSLAIANNYRAQYQQQQQIPPFNSLPSKYGPVHPTNIPQHSLHPQSASPLPVQVFYGQPGQSGGGQGSNGRPPKLNNQPYVIVSGGGGGGGGAHPNHRQHPQHPQSHPGQQQLQFEQGNENPHHNLLTSPEVIKPINPFDDVDRSR